MKIYLLFVLSLCAVLFVPAYKQKRDNDRWLMAAKRMIERSKDNSVSTTDPERIKILIIWATSEGGYVVVSHRDPTAGYKRTMYFAIVTK